MPAGKHVSKRVALAVPPKLHEQLEAWAEYEGRPLASLCLSLIETGLRDAQKAGLAPSFSTEKPQQADSSNEMSSEVVMTNNNSARKWGLKDDVVDGFDKLSKEEKEAALGRMMVGMATSK